MRKAEVTKIPDSTVGYIVSGRKKEVKRTYLKKLAEYLDATLPQSVRQYRAIHKKRIESDGKKSGGQLAIDEGLVNEAIIRSMYNTTPEEFAKKETVVVIGVALHPINFFRRLKRAKSVYHYVMSLKNQFGIEEMKKDPKLKEEVEEIDSYFKYLKTCLATGVIPLLDAKETT